MDKPEVIYQRFIERYKDDCAGFAREICGLEPTWQQEQMFQAIVQSSFRQYCQICDIGVFGLFVLKLLRPNQMQTEFPLQNKLKWPAAC